VEPPRVWSVCGIRSWRLTWPSSSLPSSSLSILYVMALPLTPALSRVHPCGVGLLNKTSAPQGLHVDPTDMSSPARDRKEVFLPLDRAAADTVALLCTPNGVPPPPSFRAVVQPHIYSYEPTRDGETT